MNSKISSVWNDLQILGHIFWRYIVTTVWIGPWLLLGSLIIFVLQWLFNIEGLLFIIRYTSQSIGEVIEFLSQGFLNIFRYPDDLTPISFILIAGLQATAVILVIRLKASAKPQLRKQTAALGVGLIGAGCVACGGSVLTPVLGALSTTFAAGVVNALSDILLIIAVILSYRVAVQAAQVYAAAVVGSHE